MVEARDEHAAGVVQKDYPSKVYANAALGLLASAEFEDRELVRARMMVAAQVCLDAARKLLWGDEKVKAGNVN